MYNITIGGEGSTGTPNLYYVINGRPLIAMIVLCMNMYYKVLQSTIKYYKVLCVKSDCLAALSCLLIAPLQVLVVQTLI